MDPILRLENMSKSFGAVKVADDLSYDLSHGEALGVIGPNGAGKTTMFNLITGTVRPDTGRIYFQNKDITQLSAPQRCRGGIARSFQIPQPFSGMTVFENTMVAATQAAGLKGHEAVSHCLEILEKTKLIDKANQLAGSLTLLERKRLELTRALCAKPSLLLLDEIAGGLTDAECGYLIDTIKEIHANGISIVWIEHVVHALLAVVDRLIVIDFGKKIAEGEPREVMDSREVQEVYLGVEVEV